MNQNLNFGSPSTTAGGGDIPAPTGINDLVSPPDLPGVQRDSLGRPWYPGANLPPAVRMILGTNPYYAGIKAGFQLPQYGWRLGGSIGNLFNKLFRGGTGSGGGGDQGDQGDGTGTWGDPQVVEWAKGEGRAPGGFSPTGQIPTGREWWSGDFGRGEMSGGAGLGPGDWISSGPGVDWGKGLGFNVGGSGTVGNLATAIGFGGPYGAMGAINYGGTGWGNSLARGQMLRAMKGLYTSPQSYAGMQHANSPLNALTGTSGPSYQQLQQSQAELGNILRANPQLLLGATSGGVPRGTPMKQVT